MNQIGKGFKILIVLLVCVLIQGCVGRGDWNYDLINNYLLIRSNAHSIGLYCYGDNVGMQSYVRVLDNYYVMAVSISDPYIGVKGIPTQERYASDEELNTPQEEYEYYLVNSTNSLIYGPYTEADYYTKCIEEDLTETDNWILTKELNMANEKVIPNE